MKIVSFIIILLSSNYIYARNYFSITFCNLSNKDLIYSVANIKDEFTNNIVNNGFERRGIIHASYNGNEACLSLPWNSFDTLGVFAGINPFEYDAVNFTIDNKNFALLNHAMASPKIACGLTNRYVGDLQQDPDREDGKDYYTIKFIINSDRSTSYFNSKVSNPYRHPKHWDGCTLDYKS